MSGRGETSGCVGHGRPDCDECYEEAMFGRSPVSEEAVERMRDALRYLADDTLTDAGRAASGEDTNG